MKTRCFACEADPTRWARTCYDHLAGTVGVRLTDALLPEGLVEPGCQELTCDGERWLGNFGIDVERLRRKRRAFLRPRLDWSERRDHLAGAVAASMTRILLERRWIVRVPDSRAVRVTPRGSDKLNRLAGLDLTAPAVAVSRVD